MPNLKSSIKDMHKARKNAIRNREVLTRLHTLDRAVRGASEAKAAAAALAACIRALDKSVSAGILHRNTASRKKSRLSAFVKKRFSKAKA